MRVSLKMLCLAFAVLTACSTATHGRAPWEQGKALPITDVRPAVPGTKVIKIELPREKYRKALQEGGNRNNARLVEVFSRGDTTQSPPEYRLFDVSRGSVYDLIGLKTADVIIAADGYVIPSPIAFWQYLALGASLPSISVEIRRDGRPLIMECTLTESKTEAAKPRG